MIHLFGGLVLIVAICSDRKPIHASAPRAELDAVERLKKIFRP